MSNDITVLPGTYEYHPPPPPPPPPTDPSDVDAFKAHMDDSKPAPNPK
jgi:hypothetical protein